MFIFNIIQLNSLVSAILPTVLIFVLNILLVNELKRSKAKCLANSSHQKRMRIRRENRRMAKTQLVLSFIFLLVSVPRSVVIIAYILQRTEWTYFLVKLLTLISYIYCDSTLVILLLHNRTFKEHFNLVMCRREINWTVSTPTASVSGRDVV